MDDGVPVGVILGLGLGRVPGRVRRAGLGRLELPATRVRMPVEVIHPTFPRYALFTAEIK
jgi:hypothetical protein